MKKGDLFIPPWVATSKAEAERFASAYRRDGKRARVFAREVRADGERLAVWIVVVRRRLEDGTDALEVFP